jgi:EAL domain-containing protein (putative c-di-GMP-specific phosphodiesterase class I)
MYTWNFQYISKNRLAEALEQLRLNDHKGDVLIRIHTAIHVGDEAVDLARFIKNIIPKAKIFGTSTSAVISWGQLLPNRCVISVTATEDVRVMTYMTPACDETTGHPLDPDVLCRRIKYETVFDDTKLLLTFLTRKYIELNSFIDKCNDAFPGVQMVGGLANTGDISMKRFLDSGFVFNENGWSDSSIIVASFGGAKLECMSSYATGVQPFGEECEVTDTFAHTILSLDGKDAAQEYILGVGNDLRERADIASLFPYAYSDAGDIPVFVRFSKDESLEDIYPKEQPLYQGEYDSHPDIDTSKPREFLSAYQKVSVGRKLRRAFIYDRQVIADNRSMFRKIENFKKAETLFGYSCIVRSMIYSNCVKWELSAYANSNISGCITEGEIVCVNGRNTVANCSFVVSVFGEREEAQEYNPYVFSHTETLSQDNKILLNYLLDVESYLEKNNKDEAASNLREFVQDCESKLLFSEEEEIPNAAALSMDIKLSGYDRVCMISVSGVAGMKAVFSEELVNLTRRDLITKCSGYAKTKGYRVYLIDEWQLAIAETSYKVTLSQFTADMEKLQRDLFEYSEDHIAIVPMFCLIDGCTEENLDSLYYKARIDMANKNVQFIVVNALDTKLDVESILERYHIVNVIKYAIDHDKVIPYFQGIYDNKTNSIHHYESLMRLQDETGKIYYPGSFLDVARSYGLLYDALSRKMIEKVFEKFKDVEDKSVSMNVSIRDIKDKEMSEYIFDSLASVAHPENFVFEILENEDIDDYNLMMAFVDRIHDLGGKISIDDFGSGFSNLQHIAEIHSDFIKIDGSIVKRCHENVESEHLVALITYWKKLGDDKVKIVAEFVENQEIQDVLLKYNIDFSQGYLFSKPAPDLME